MNAATTRRPCLPAWARTLRMKWTRQRCQEACRTLATAALSPSWASEITSLTPRRPRRASERRNSVQKVSASEAPIAMPSTSRRPSLLTATARMTATETMRPLARSFTNDRPHPPFAQIIDRARRHAVHVSVLDNRGDGFLGQAPRFQKHREVAALAQLWDAQLDRPGAGLPDPVSVAIAVIDAVRAALAVRGTGQAFDFELHQALRGKTHHLAQQIGIRALLQQRAKAH